jgi:hypothetical protein
MSDTLQMAWNLRYVIGLAAVILLVTARIEKGTSE